VDLKIEGLRELRILKNELREMVTAGTEVQARSLKAIGTEYPKAFRAAMLRQESPEGAKHRPLVPASKYPNKKKRNPFNHILINSYLLFKSLRMITMRRDSVTVGVKSSDVPYAEAVHFGGPRGDDVQLAPQHASDWAGRRTLPPRPIVGISKEGNREAAAAIRAWGFGRYRERLARAWVEAWAQAVEDMK
jgi:hypothetical protein